MIAGVILDRSQLLLDADKCETYVDELHEAAPPPHRPPEDMALLQRV